MNTSTTLCVNCNRLVPVSCGFCVLCGNTFTDLTLAKSVTATEVESVVARKQRLDLWHSVTNPKGKYGHLVGIATLTLDGVSTYLWEHRAA